MKKVFIVMAGLIGLSMTSCKKQQWCEYSCKWVHYTNGQKDFWSSTNGKIWQSDECRQSFVEEGSVTHSYSSTTGNSYTHQKECTLK